MTNDVCLSEDYARHLVETVAESCSNVEELALEEISSRHIPLLNSTFCLTNEDCKIILDKCQQNCHNMLEQSVLLIAITDFISCVSANYETFPLESKKNERKRISLLLQMLQDSWGRLFTKLSAEDMNVSQVNSIIRILKRCLERIPSNRGYKMFVEIILKMTDKALHELLKPPEVNDLQSSDDEELSNKVMEHHNATSVKMPAVPGPVLILRHKKEKKRRRKQGYDITKFVLKPCENVIKEEQNEQKGNNALQKRKFHEIKEVHESLGDEQIKKDPVILRENVDAPPAKKHCVHDDLINGKVNAFKMLMKPRKTEKLYNSSCQIKV